MSIYQRGAHGDVVATGDHHLQQAVDEPPGIRRKALDQVAEVLSQARLERFVGDGQIGKQLLCKGLKAHGKADMLPPAVMLD
jgi:hypothetical protein